MSIISMPLPERIPCDRNGFPEGHYAAFRLAVGRFKEMVNDLPGPIDYLTLPDAENILDVIIRDYLRNVVRER